MRQQVSGRETVQEVELLEGREALKGWIVRFSDVDTVEQVCLLGLIELSFTVEIIFALFNGF